MISSSQKSSKIICFTIFVTLTCYEFKKRKVLKLLKFDRNLRLHLNRNLNKDVIITLFQNVQNEMQNKVDMLDRLTILSKRTSADCVMRKGIVQELNERYQQVSELVFSNKTRICTIFWGGFIPRDVLF